MIPIVHGAAHDHPGGSSWSRSKAKIEIADLPKAIRETERELIAAQKRVDRLSGALMLSDASAKRRQTMRVNLELACAHRDTMESKRVALLEAKLLGRKLLRSFVTEMTGDFSKEMAVGFILAMNLMRAEPEWAMAMYASLESEFEASPLGMPVPKTITDGIREFVLSHPISAVT